MDARVPLVVNRNRFNSGYLDTKAAKLGHMFLEEGIITAEPADEQDDV